MEGLVESRIMTENRVSLFQRRVIAEKESSIRIAYTLPLAT